MSNVTSKTGLLVALSATAATLAAHLLVLLASGQDPVTTPVHALSRDVWGGLQTAGLLAFALAHVALAGALGGLDRGRLWPLARVLLVATGIALAYVTWFFATAPDSRLQGPGASDPLWIVASLTGFTMGALQPGLARQSRGLGLFSVLVLGAWLWLVPLALFVNESWVGGYERLVGLVYVTWLVGVSLGLLRADGAHSQRPDS